MSIALIGDTGRKLLLLGTFIVILIVVPNELLNWQSTVLFSLFVLILTYDAYHTGFENALQSENIEYKINKNDSK